MEHIFVRFIRRILSAFTNNRGEAFIPDKQENLPDKQKSQPPCEPKNNVVVPGSMKIEGKVYCVNSVFDRESRESVADKLNYLLGDRTKK